MKHLKFIDEHGSFTLKQPENTSFLYLPLASETGLKSSVTPSLGGDAKIDQETFLLEPVSSENLHNNRSTRNFWVTVTDCQSPEKGDAPAYSAAGASAEQEACRFSSMQDESELSAGFMWQSLRRSSKALKLSSIVTSFIPKDANVEIMYVTIQNCSDRDRRLTAWGAIPIYGRSADNIRDHRNVTSMLHRITTDKNGVFVCPTMSFDEKGHRPNNRIYYVLGCTGDGSAPTGFYPTVEDFIGEGGTFTHPGAVYNQKPGAPAGVSAAGKEAMGAFRFEPVLLAPKETVDYILLLGAENSREDIALIAERFNCTGKVKQALNDTMGYWRAQVCTDFHTRDADFDHLMKWICFQPFLRRLFGCSFLPHHDYGRGGRGWRDLWQDCLSLLLMEPEKVRRMIVMNYGGVRIDGTNATIIGEGDGNFLADRNGIARVWMDHALWPLMTTKLYIDQTGDVDILNQKVSYFKDAQIMRGTAIDALWKPECGNEQRTDIGDVYTGTLLEHLLLQQLAAFYEVGEHNIYRLRGADWNDALDMASERGESVAFTCAYAGNLSDLAAMIRLLDRHSPSHKTEFLKEIAVLLDQDSAVFDQISKKQEILDSYTEKCCHTISGSRICCSLEALAENLTQKAEWLKAHLRSQEWISVSDEEGWYNSYYDNHGRAVEGIFQDHVRMMLTGQVFAVMSKTADDAQTRKIIKSADHYLYQKDIGGYRLNTDFGELKFDMGRMFGFAYGEKENGAVFSHMTVMYANALYRRGYAKEGWKALKTLADTALNFDISHIYPGIPEYFRSDGRGMYQYLTGAASWFMLTMITEVFGVRGEEGNLVLYPKLLKEQFDDSKTAAITVPFADHTFRVIYKNEDGKDFGSYRIGSAFCDGAALTADESSAVLPREAIPALAGRVHTITVYLY